MNPDEWLVDQALLEQARQVLGSAEIQDTLEQALSQAIQRASRDHAIEAEVARLIAGHYRALPADRGGGRLLPGRPGSMLADRP
jgi:hypothetical protein